MRNLHCLIQRTFLFFLFTSFIQVANAQMSLQLTPSSYNGYNVSCFGSQNGSINLTVTGGTSPFTYAWSNSATTEDLSLLPAGYYSVLVTDANSNTAQGQITLTEPQEFFVRLTPSEYTLSGHTFNISCAICYDGTITSSLTNGISPFTYLWDDATTTQNRSGLYEGSYKLTVSDNNGCKAEESVYLDAPERTDWQITGNTGTIPATNFVGTSDNVDLSFRTNNTEAMRIKANGSVVVNALSGNGNKYLVTDNNGKLAVAPLVPWEIGGNIVGSDASLGTNDAKDLIIETDGQERMRVAENGIVGIGVDPANETFNTSGYKLVVNGKIGVRQDLYVRSSGAWPDYVFKKDYRLFPLNELSSFIKENGHLPNMPPASEIEADGQAVGRIQLLQQEKIEELVLYILELEKRIKLLEAEKK